MFHIIVDDGLELRRFAIFCKVPGKCEQPETTDILEGVLGNKVAADITPDTKVLIEHVVYRRFQLKGICFTKCAAERTA